MEYCCVVYHPLLTGGQSEDIEKLQKQAAKLAFGWNRSYSQICEDENIVTLKKRREKYVDNFILKTLMNERFRVWFPTREEDGHNLRGRRNFVETRAKTNRYFNSPISFMRRRANELQAEMYGE